MPTQNAYDALAPHYRDYSGKRGEYLAAVDQYVIDGINAANPAILDVGAGDGVRGTTIARASQASRLVLSDNSAAMADMCRQQGADEVWECTAEELPGEDATFDVVLCLWNVLGHIPDRASRVASLKRIVALLKPGGQLFIDVNNRHNALAYGRRRVLMRRLLDSVYYHESRGDVSYVWEVAGSKFPSRGHLFIPREVETLFAEAGLLVENRVSINYATGEKSDSPHAGQLVYTLCTPRAMQAAA